MADKLLSRRDFLKATAAGVGIALLGKAQIAVEGQASENILNIQRVQ